MIADHDDGIRGMLAEFLSDEGYQVRQTPNGSAVLRAIADHPPALLLLDLLLPIVSGKEVLAQVQAAEQDIPVILLTTAFTSAEQGTQRYGVACIVKPFDLDELLDCVEQYLPHE